MGRKSKRAINGYRFFLYLSGTAYSIIGSVNNSRPHLIAGALSYGIAAVLNLLKDRRTFKISHADFPIEEWKLL